ncbi:hypothetical protein DVS28_a1457 [Euzebya pacifica]|uniref:Uncharacterized protein n=1 Tax=Euzebya pacifica TaxID=1608957 RepID=A0A346XVA9_9ACTN|nr:hypothetical protein [Euzebya pacifica]AXV06156.1 hypothetical protein DVS28_a1457 [Euzebya pacifica]
MHRPLLALLTLVLALLGAPAGAASDTTTISDPCGGTPIGTSAVAPGQDVCTVSMTTLQAGVDEVTGEPLTTILAVTMELAGDPQELPSAFLTVWSAGDCGFIPYQTDNGGLAESGSLSVHCGEATRRCLPRNLLCDVTYEFEAEYPVDITFGPNTVTWTITFDGELGAAFSELHREGSPLGFGGITTAGPSWAFDTPLATFACSTDGGCVEPVGDFVVGGATHHV